MVHKDEWADHSPQTEWKDPFHVHFRAYGRSAGFNDEIKHNLLFFKVLNADYFQPVILQEHKIKKMVY